MTFANPIPWWAFAFVVAAAAGLSWLVYRRFAAAPHRRYVLTALRTLLLVTLALFLMRPIVRRDTGDMRDAVVPILIDASRSMGIEDAGGRRRIDAARDLLERDLLPALGSRFTVETLAFGERVEPVGTADLSATGRRSDLANALAEVRARYRGRPVAGIVLLSDGGDTSGAGEVEIQRDATPPVYAFGVGSPTVGRDREVLSLTAAEAILDDSRIDLAVSAVSHGHGTDPIELRLLANGRPVEVRRVSPAADGTPVRTVFQVAPEGRAATVYTVDIPAAAGELVPENNSRSAIVQVPSRARRVLVVEGAPGFEHSFLERAWSGDRDIDVDSVVRKGRDAEGGDTFYIQAARDRSAALTTGFPSRLEDLFAYDAVVLANVDAAQLTRAQLEAMRAFVSRRGGGLLVLGARSLGRQGLLESALAEALPLTFTDRGDAALPAAVSRASRVLNRVAITGAGLEHPVMQLGSPADTQTRWDGVPALAAITPVGGPRPGASVLAVTNGPGGAPRALITVQRYGEGRSMVFTGEASWRWRMMLPSTDRSFDTFWRQALRWLAVGAADPVAIAAPSDLPPGDVGAVRVVARNEAFEAQRSATVEVHVIAPDGTVQVLPAVSEGDGYTTPLRPVHPGVYRITAEARTAAGPLGSASTAVLVGGSDLEMTDPRLNESLLQRVATASGGRLLDRPGIGALAGTLAAGVPAARLAVQEDAWHTGWSFAAVLVLLGTEWGLRRRWGLR